MYEERGPSRDDSRGGAVQRVHERPKGGPGELQRAVPEDPKTASRGAPRRPEERRHPGSLWTRLGRLWSALEAVLEASGAPHGSIWTIRSDVVVGLSGAFWKQIRSLLGPVSVPVGDRLGASWEPLGGLSGVSWEPLGASWGASWRHLGGVSGAC